MIDHARIAEALESARRRTQTLVPISQTHASFDVADAYEVGRHIAIIRESTGSKARGFKIGFTYLPTWQRIGITAPFWAPVYDIEAQLEQPLITGDFTSPRLEPEVVVGIGTAIGQGAELDEIEAAIDWIALGFEIVDCHFPKWQATPPDLIADHGCHAQIRLGDQVEPAGETLTALRDLTVELTCDSEIVEIGTPTNVLGGVIEAVAQCLELPNAPRANAGDVISTGSLTGRSHPVNPGERWGIVPRDGSQFASLELRVE